MMRTQAKTNQLLKTLAGRMRERRKSLGLTQEQLAEKSGLSPNYIAKLEIGDRIPSLSTLIRLAESLHIEVYELLAVYAGRPWTGAAQEVERVMESLSERDSEFLLGEFRNIAEYIRSLRQTKEDSSTVCCNKVTEEQESSGK